MILDLPAGRVAHLPPLVALRRTVGLRPTEGEPQLSLRLCSAKSLAPLRRDGWEARSEAAREGGALHENVPPRVVLAPLAQERGRGEITEHAPSLLRENRAR